MPEWRFAGMVGVQVSPEVQVMLKHVHVWMQQLPEQHCLRNHLNADITTNVRLCTLRHSCIRRNRSSVVGFLKPSWR